MPVSRRGVTMRGKSGAGEIRACLAGGVDAVLIDDPATGRAAVDAMKKQKG